MFDEKPCCGNCRYHFHVSISDGWICSCNASDYFADWTDFDFCCDEYEERE